MAGENSNRIPLRAIGSTEFRAEIKQAVRKCFKTELAEWKRRSHGIIYGKKAAYSEEYVELMRHAYIGEQELYETTKQALSLLHDNYIGDNLLARLNRAFKLKVKQALTKYYPNEYFYWNSMRFTYKTYHVPRDQRGPDLEMFNYHMNVLITQGLPHRYPNPSDMDYIRKVFALIEYFWPTNLFE